MVVAIMLMHGQLVLAAEKVMASKVVRIVNPASKVGIQIGDVLKRQVVIVVDADKKITPKSIPLKNTRTDGVELVDVKLTASEKGQQQQFLIELSYQVFSNASEPTEVALPKEVVSILDTEELLIPAWQFWYSPLVKTTMDKAKAHVQLQDKSPLIDVSQHRYRLFAYAALLLVGLLGLFYINADANWLPWMGGNFAKAYRKIKRLSKGGAIDAVGNEQALAVLHQAFNQTYGRNLFANEVDAFVLEHPSFGKVESEIMAFFALSNQILFDDNVSEAAALTRQLHSLSRQLRDVERGV